MDLTIWHNPRCSKSRQTLAVLEDRGLAPTVRLYLEDAPTETEIRDALDKLGMDDPRALMRKGEDEYKAQGCADMEGDALVAAMAGTPKLIERPIVFKGTKARIGRPPEGVVDIL